MKGFRRRAVAASLLAALIVVTLSGRSVPVTASGQHMKSASIVLDWYPNSDHGGLFTAIARGYFKARGIDMTAHVPSDTSAQIKLVAANKADFGITYETDVIAAQVQHIPVKSVMCIMQHPLNTLMALKSTGITHPAQLAGHTIGAAGDPSDRPLVSAMMKADHSSVQKTRIVNVGYNLLPALLSKRVDSIIGGYWTWEAIEAQEKGKPVNVMRLEKWGVPNYCELVLIVNSSTIKNNPSFVRGTVQAMQQGYAYAASHPTVAWNALHKQDRTLSSTLVLASLRLLKPVVTDTSTIGLQNGAQWQHYASWLSANKLISGHVNASTAFTNQFLKMGVK